MRIDLDRVLQTFIAESRELLADAEAYLQRLQVAPADTDAIAGTFRAVHTIKGSAGMFGYEDVVAFAHVVETLLDELRGGRLAIEQSLSGLLFECCDHLGDLIALRIGELPADRDVGPRNAQLRARLGQASRGGPAPPPPVAAETSPVPAAECWHISLRFDPGVFHRGIDPASFLRYLGSLGQIRSMRTLVELMPSAEAMNPESCYLGLEIDFAGIQDRHAVESAFEFFDDDCRLYVLPHHGELERYAELLNAAQREGLDLGPILVQGGALSAQELQQLMQPVPEPVAIASEAVAATRVPHSAFVRVDADRLEQLINEVGEMVIATASSALIAQRSGDSEMMESMSLLARMVEQVRDGALGLRMVEIGETFRRFQRVARDVSRELGKDIVLRIRGEDAELDKTVVEKIGDPLLHLVRNAMDHGIEPAELRRARGKPAQGRVELNAYHESGSIVIEVSDDGGGLSVETILRKARERGLVDADKTPPDAEIFKLIFEPGFSTAEQVTNLSGRGVGLDVVRRNIEALRGSIETDSRLGAGTTFRIRLPLTLAIIDGFLVRVGESSLVVPLSSVVECLELPADSRQARLDYLDLRDEVLPLVRLGEALSLAGGSTSRQSVVVVRAGTGKAGLVVDRLLGEFQTVIKPLGGLFRHLRGISGSTILGSGEVALILDVAALLTRAERSEQTRTFCPQPATSGSDGSAPMCHPRYVAGANAPTPSVFS